MMRNLVWLAVLCLVGQGSVFPGADDEAAVKKSWLEIGIQERIRSENFNNILDFNADREDMRKQWRFRSKIWADFHLGDRFNFKVQLNNEARKITRQPSQAFDVNEVIFEHLYADLRFNRYFSFRVGRQDIMRGEGFLIFEGNALDGSRTAYFNAAKAQIDFNPLAKLELMAIYNPSRDIFLPKINNDRKVLTEWDEQALGAYFTHQGLSRGIKLEGYYFFKKEFNDIRPSQNPQFQPDRFVHTLGGRVQIPVGRGFSATSEWAGQWGHQRPSDPIRAWGGYAYLAKDFAHSIKPRIKFGYWGMSGDDPATSKIEGWDPLFSRWPKWSELYIYSLVFEKGPAYWTNCGMWQLEFSCQPIDPIRFRATYYHMNAFHPFAGDGTVFGAGTRRGDLLEARLDVKAGKRWSGHIMLETLAPGDFYSKQDSGYFFRFEFVYHLSRRLDLF